MAVGDCDGPARESSVDMMQNLINLGLSVIIIMVPRRETKAPKSCMWPTSDARWALEALASLTFGSLSSGSIPSNSDSPKQIHCQIVEVLHVLASATTTRDIFESVKYEDIREYESLNWQDQLRTSQVCVINAMSWALV
jgi:hypothetical protein